MVQERKLKRASLSAFAVSQAQLGKHGIDGSVTSELAKKVQTLHADEKFNKKALSVATNYERNLLTNERKKRKRKAGAKLAAKLAHAAEHGDGAEAAEPAAKPLNWHSAPKSDKRMKLVESTDAVPASVRNKKRRTRRGKKSKKASTTESTEPANETTEPALANVSPEPDSSENSTTEEPISASVKEREERERREERETATAEKADRKPSKKVSVAEWTPPVKKSNGVPISKQRRDEPELSYSDDSDDESYSRIEHDDPEQVARELFAKLLHPHDPKTFFRKTWLKKPLHIKRKDPQYYEEDDWFSTRELDRILAEERVRFGVNIDLTTYKDGKRETHNPAGRAYPAIVWDHYQQGCSVRLLNPQTYCEETWYLLSTLQELFGCMVGANVYLTPPGTQGFAPHYDDIEAFVLQLEGRKRWKVYGPRTDADIWPLTSSPNLTEEGLGKPVIDCVLEPGDLLYFPRGSIHQAMAQDDEHSLHITVSTHQKNSWSDLFNLMIPAALANATDNNPEFRESLPNDYLNYTGIAFQEQEGSARQAFMSKVQKLMESLVNFAPVDGACDLMAKKFIHDSLPPYLDPTERGYSVAEQGEKWTDGEVREAVELQPDTRIRLIRKHSIRLVNESIAENAPSRTTHNEGDEHPDSPNSTADDVADDNMIRAYFNTDNDRLYHGNEIQFFEVDGELAPAIEQLQLTYPEFISIDELPLEDVTNKVDIAMQLYDRGLLITEELLDCVDMMESECSDQSDSDVTQ